MQNVLILILKSVPFTYRVAQQCCPGGNRPETPRRPSAGGLRIFWAKSLVITAIYTNLSLIFVYMARITSDLTQKIRRPPVEGLRGGSGQFPPGQHCWSTRYVTFKAVNAMSIT